jgi:DNA-binding Lrp family transcriptional regulator
VISCLQAGPGQKTITLSEIDHTNRKILAILQRHGRVPLTELAQEVGPGLS